MRRQTAPDGLLVLLDAGAVGHDTMATTGPDRCDFRRRTCHSYEDPGSAATMLDSSLRALDEKFNASLTTANEDWGKRFDSLEPLVQELHKLLTTDLPHAIRDLEKIAYTSAYQLFTTRRPPSQRALYSRGPIRGPFTRFL